MGRCSVYCGGMRQMWGLKCGKCCPVLLLVEVVGGTEKGDGFWRM